TGPAHVTVAVTPAQAQALVLAAARGKIHLALRAADDDTVVSLPAFPAAPLVRDAARPAPTRPHPKPLRPMPAPPVKPVEEALPLPPIPVKLPLSPPAHVTVTVIKGSQSQTVSVEP
ncbi:MAG: RcpC/CpaB family pilus assembly protein, partial [Armatimonadota bacterium]|nr:RcpC/CpaB family pilus assembly protein [Armatimonadota bacterium]